MTDEKWTRTQLMRFLELGIDPESIETAFSTPKERNNHFQQIEKKKVKVLRKKLNDLLSNEHKTQLMKLKESIVEALCQEGFTGVNTPTVISKQALKKMGIDEDHALSEQIFWLNDKQCLRPMLAPNLYSLMMDFSRLCNKPVSFYEIGSCFRKESSGARHSNEFTMLNLVEMGLPENERHDRLTYLANLIMKAASISDYRFESEDSVVYGSTIDVEAGPDFIEVASGAMGPHPLDDAWGITDTWVGMGFGLERLIMIANQDSSIGRWSRSLTYLDGICLNL